MPAKITVAGETATVTGGVWACDDPIVLAAIEVTSNGIAQLVTDYMPGFDVYMAHRVADAMDGEFLSGKPEPIVAGRVY